MGQEASQPIGRGGGPTRPGPKPVHRRAPPSPSPWARSCEVLRPPMSVAGAMLAVAGAYPALTQERWATWRGGAEKERRPDPSARRGRGSAMARPLSLCPAAAGGRHSEERCDPADPVTLSPDFSLPSYAVPAPRRPTSARDAPRPRRACLRLTGLHLEAMAITGIACCSYAERPRPCRDASATGDALPDHRGGASPPAAASGRSRPLAPPAAADPTPRRDGARLR